MNPPVLKNLKTSAVLAAGALTLSVLAAAPAVATDEPMGQNAPSAPTAPAAAAEAPHSFGKVVAKTGVNIRKHPNTWSKILGGFSHGQVIRIDCKVKGENILGNDRWYKRAYKDGWVSARWVKNLDHVPWCH